MNSSEFVKALLSQDAALNAPSYSEHRQNLLNRLAQAEQRERRGRFITIAAGTVVFLFFSIMYAIVVSHEHSNQHFSVPDWVGFVLVLSAILLPSTAILLAAIYFFRHRREVRRVRDEAYRAALLDLPRQIGELRRQLDELRQPPPPASNADAKLEGKRAFTLTEMLVTICILTLLAGLLFPALSQAKAQARLAQCRNNLSQVGKALIMYEGDAGAYPGVGLPVQRNGKILTRTDDSWDGRLRPYLARNTNALNCPSSPPRVEATLQVDAYGYNAGGTCEIYDFSQNLGLGFAMTNTTDPLIRGSDIRSPADMVAIGDFQTPSSVWVNIITPNMPRPMGNVSSVIPDRHRGGANMVFCDGHVEFAKQGQWTAPTDAARRRWNNDNAPHPESWR